MKAFVPDLAIVPRLLTRSALVTVEQTREVSFFSPKAAKKSKVGKVATHFRYRNLEW